MSYTVLDVYNQARSALNDMKVSGGEIATNTRLLPKFQQAYRTLYRKTAGKSQRVRNTVYVPLPASQEILNPSLVAVTDMFEPVLVEMQESGASVAISTTSAASPIVVTTSSPHGLGDTGAVVEVIISSVVGTLAPWGRNFITITGASTFTINGSLTDGATGSGGIVLPWTQLPFVAMTPLDFEFQGLDGTVSNNQGAYIFQNGMFKFRGYTIPQLLRITYWASGNAPSNPSTLIGIDDALDFLAIASAANLALSLGWAWIYGALKEQAYGNDPENDGGLLKEWVRLQSIKNRRRQKREMPFRPRRTARGTLYPVN